MGNTVKEIKKYRQGCEITEYVIDNDVFKVVEEYKDDKGEVVYIYEYYPTTGELMKAMKEREKTSKDSKKNKNVKKNRRRGR